MAFSYVHLASLNLSGASKEPQNRRIIKSNVKKSAEDNTANINPNTPYYGVHNLTVKFSTFFMNIFF